ncbi:MAG: hypothetical protein OES13_06675 [Acidimicrobiia bacterium]|nr:hypothetical protein [Acidimicrobiia bacterium]
MSLALLSLALVQCTSAEPPEWPELGSQEQRLVVDLGQLEAVPGVTQFDPHAAPGVDVDLFDEGELVPGVVRQRYESVTVGGFNVPSAGTDVFYVPDEKQFYLFEDHMAGHLDWYIGPFAGDPRLVLKEAVGPWNPEP